MIDRTLTLEQKRELLQDIYVENISISPLTPFGMSMTLAKCKDCVTINIITIENGELRKQS